MIKCDTVPPCRIAWNRNAVPELGPKFETIFGTNIRRFMSPFFGFDIVKFDTWIGSIDGRSCKEITIEQYGQEGMDMIEKLLDGPLKPDAVETWTDVEFDIHAAAISTGFKRCEFSFLATNALPMTGAGYYKGGLIVHRDFIFIDGEWSQVSDGHWLISTMQGSKAGSKKTLKGAKKLASQFSMALDFRKAQTFNFTDAQMNAAKRVYLFLKEEANGLH